jgi:hypothetical protein
MRIGWWRRALAWVALVCHLVTAFGFPVPTAAAQQKGDSTPYPCQDHPCGCLTAAQCWEGDCCCFTIEDKLRWAEEKGIEPPAHVRPLVASRASRPTPAAKRKKACCSEHALPEAPPPRPVEPSCCSREAKPTAECPACNSTAPVKACCDAPTAPVKACCDAPTEPSREDAPAPAEKRSSVRWVAGIFAQKCRGSGPAGALELDPQIVPDLTPVAVAVSEQPAHSAPRSDRATFVPHLPPTPPPRQA